MSDHDQKAKTPEPFYKAEDFDLDRWGGGTNDLAANQANAKRDQEIERLRAKVEDYEGRVHSCGPKCSMAGCVARRLRGENKRLTYQLDMGAKDLQTIHKLHDMLRCYQAELKAARDALADMQTCSGALCIERHCDCDGMRALTAVKRIDDFLKGDG